MNFLLVVLGFTLLVFGGNYLLKSAVGFSLRLNVPKIVIGMTVVSFATSAPELIVSLNSALEGHADIALGKMAMEDEGDMYESIEEIWPDYPTEEDYLWNEDEY